MQYYHLSLELWSLFTKVHIFWEGHKNLKQNIPISLTHSVLSNIKKVGCFFQIFVAYSEYLNFITGPRSVSSVHIFWGSSYKMHGPKIGHARISHSLLIWSRSALKSYSFAKLKINLRFKSDLSNQYFRLKCQKVSKWIL